MASGVNIATAFISLVPSVQGIQGNIAQAFQPAETEADAAGERSGKKLALAAGAAIAASAAVIGVGLKKAFDLGGVFDDINDTIRVGTGATGQALEGLNDVAKKIGSTIPVEFDKIGGTVADLNTRMGLTGDNLQTVASQFLQAGQILGQDVDVNKATAAFSAFGIQGDQVSAAMDNLFRVSQATGLGMNDLTAAAAAQAPALQELGFSFEDTISLVGSLDKAGLNATAITASLGKGLVKLAKDGEEPQQAFERVTGQITDLVSQGKNAQAIDLASGIFGTKGATQFVGAIQSGTLNMQDLMAATGATQDTILGLGTETADAAESWQLLKNKAMLALEPIGTAVFNLAGEGMGKLVDSFDVVSQKATYFWSVFSGKNDAVDDGPFLQFTQTVGQKIRGDLIPAAHDLWAGLSQGPSNLDGVLGAGSPLFQIGAMIHEQFGGIFDTLKQAWDQIGPPLMDAFKTIWDAVQPLIPTFLQLFQAFNPVGLLFKALLPILPQIAGVVGQLAKVLADGVARALQAVAPLFQKIVDVINRLMPFVTKLVASLLPPLVSLFDKLAPLLDAVLDALVPVVDAIVDALIPAIDALMPTVERVFTFIADTITNVMTVIGGIIDVITGVFTGDWEKVWTGVKEIFGGIWDQIKNIFSTLWDVIVEFFTNLAPRLWEIVTGLAGQLAQWGGQFLGWIWQGIQDLWNGTIWPWFQSLPGLAWEGIKAAASQMVTWGGEFLSWLWSGVTDFWDETAWPWITSLPQTLWDGITGFAGGVGSWLSDRGSEFLNWIWQGTDGNGGIVGASKGVVQWFADLPGKIWDAVKGIWASASEWGGQLMKYVVDGISGSDPYVSAAFAKTMINAVSGIVPVDTVAGLFNIDINKNIDDYIAGLQRQSNLNAASARFGSSSSGPRIPGRATGGLFGPYSGHDGGMIQVGSHGTADDVLIRGSKNEFMVNAQATSRHLPLLEYINDGGTVPGFAGGGMIGGLGRLAGGYLMKAVLPSLLSAVSDGVKNSSSGSGSVVLNGNLTVNGYTAGLPEGPRGEFLKAVATKMGTSYVWGAAGPDVFDCSGLMSWGLQQAGVGKGRLTAEGFNSSFPHIGKPGKPGDLATFDTGRLPGQAGHIGVIFDPARGLMMHTDGAGPARVGDYFSRDGGPLSIVDVIGGAANISAAARAAGPAGDAPDTFGSKLGRLLGNSLSSKFGFGASTAYTASAGTEQWRATVLQALGITGQPASYADTVLNQMRTESSGNPRAINLTDINAQRGIPSKGLMQVIDPTFRSYALPGYNTDIYDPLSNIIASIRYVLSRYGSIPAGMRGVAYQFGGMVPDLFGGGIDSVPAMLTPGEGVLTAPEVAAYRSHAAALADGYAGRLPEITVNVSIDGEQLDARAVVLIDGRLADQGSRLVTTIGQGR